MWKLPLFGVRDADAIAKAAAECHRDNPGHHVRISAIERSASVRSCTALRNARVSPSITRRGDRRDVAIILVETQYALR